MRSPLIVVLSLSVALWVAPAVAQDGGGGGGGEGGGGGGGGNPQPTIDLPLIGEVPVPGFLASLFGIEAEAQGETGQQQPTAVTYTIAETQPVADSFSFLGRIEAIEEVAVQTRVPGFIEDVAFRGGDTVAQGDLLFQIETAQYDAELESADAAQSSAEAQKITAERALERSQELRESGTVSQASFDDARAAFEAAEGELLQAQASRRQAQLNLDYTTITAPISGKMTEAFQTRGNFVSTSTGSLAELVQLDPIWGVFALGENRLLEWRRLGMTGADATADTGGARDLSAEGYDLKLVLPDGTDYDQAGQLSFVGNSVDATSGTVDVRVAFDNPDSLLLPNQSVTLRVVESDPPVYPIIPQAAIQLGREGRAVWIVADDDTAQRVAIEVQPMDTPGQVAVVSGLTGGERVIVRGGMALSEGSKVDPRLSEDARPGSGSGGGGSSSDGSGNGGSADGADGAGSEDSGSAASGGGGASDPSSGGGSGTGSEGATDTSEDPESQTDDSSDQAAEGSGQ